MALGYMSYIYYRGNPELNYGTLYSNYPALPLFTIERLNQKNRTDQIPPKSHGLPIAYTRQPLKLREDEANQPKRLSLRLHISHVAELCHLQSKLGRFRRRCATLAPQEQTKGDYHSIRSGQAIALATELEDTTRVCRLLSCVVLLITVHETGTAIPPPNLNLWLGFDSVAFYRSPEPTLSRLGAQCAGDKCCPFLNMGTECLCEPRQPPNPPSPLACGQPPQPRLLGYIRQSGWGLHLSSLATWQANYITSTIAVVRILFSILDSCRSRNPPSLTFPSIFMHSSIRTTLIRALCLTLYMHVVTGQNLADDRLSLVRTRLQESANRSWELGTAAQALLEIDAPSWSVFSRNSLPPPQQVPSDAQSSVAPVFTLAQEIVGNRSRLNSNAEGPQPLMPDASAADPAANGVSVLLANWTGQGGQDYAGAARDQLDFLLERVPRTDDGAISHREAEVQLWSDYVYMVPPFLAFYGVLTRNQSLVTEAYNQIRLYRQYLRDDDNLWKHIAMGGEVAEDNGHWTTGNGWAAAGMLRVLATIQNSEYDKSMAHQQADLAHWVGEIHGAIYPLLDDTNIFPNYASRAVNDSGNFYDAAGTALLAATVYRVSLYWGDHSHISFAQRCRETLYADNGNQSHINAEGWLQPVVNPHSFGVEGSRSPEAQAFVLDLEAAYRDWVNEGSNDSTHLTISNLWIWAGIVLSLLLWV